MKHLILRHHPPIATAKGPRLIDAVRRQLVPATPEEQVRQSVLHCLMENYGYPVSALHCEEPVARGTVDRRRADVFVFLPASSATADLQMESVAEEAYVEPAYSEKVRALRACDEEDASYSYISLPDTLDLQIDGVAVRCRTLGFVRLKSGHGLGFVAENPPHGLPPIIPTLINGYGMRVEEKALAQRLGLPELEWNFDSTLAFIDAIAPLDGNLVWRILQEDNTLSADGESAAMLTRADPQDWFQVMARFAPEWVDASTEQEPLSEPSQAPEGVKTTAPSPAALVQADWRDANRVIAVIECKAPGISLTREVLNQGLGYASTLGAEFLVVTNGLDSHAYRLGGQEPVRVEDIPTCQAVLSDTAFSVRALQKAEARSRLPPDAADRPDCVRLHGRYRDRMGARTPLEFWLPILALDDALFGQQRILTAAVTSHGITAIEDLGINAHDPGSPTGASSPGYYRDFLVECPDKTRLILGISILAAGKQVDRGRLTGFRISPSWYTYLVVGISDDATYQSALQLPFDKHLVRAGDEWRLTHNGALTAGKGAVKREVLREALRTEAPQLLPGKLVDLGRFPHGASIPAPALWDMLGRIARYVLVRRSVKDATKRMRAHSRV